VPFRSASAPGQDSETGTCSSGTGSNARTCPSGNPASARPSYGSASAKPPE
jgi:hypothetical protein